MDAMLWKLLLLCGAMAGALANIRCYQCEYTEYSNDTDRSLESDESDEACKDPDDSHIQTNCTYCAKGEGYYGTLGNIRCYNCAYSSSDEDSDQGCKDPDESRIQAGCTYCIDYRISHSKEEHITRICATGSAASADTACVGYHGECSTCDTDLCNGARSPHVTTGLLGTVMSVMAISILSTQL